MRKLGMRIAMAGLLATGVTACGGASGGASSSSTGGSANPTASTSTSSSGGATASSTPLMYSQPAAKGELDSITWDLPNGEPTTVDPIKAGDYGPNMISSNLCDDLFRLTPKWGEVPEIAQSYKYSPDHKTLVLNIRHGVKFWDGHPLTGADVAFSLQRTMSAKSGSINSAWFDFVSSIAQTGPYQVTIKYKKPDELLFHMFATGTGAVVEKAYVDKVGNKAFGSSKSGVMCSGPYELTKWSPGQQMVLTKNPHYWDQSLQPKIKTVTVKFISNTSTLTSALQSGEIDGAYEVPMVSIPALRKVSSGKLYYGPGLGIQQVRAAQKTGLAHDIRVRAAIGMVLDRAAIAQKIFSGAAQPNLAMTPPNAWGSGPAKSIYAAAYKKLPGATPDLAAAKKLIANVPNHTQPLTLAIEAGDQTSIELATLIQQYASQIGLTIKIVQKQPLDYSNIFYEPQYRKGLDFVMSSGYLDIPDMLDYLVYTIYPDSSSNWEGFDNKKVVALTNQARQTFNPVARAKILVKDQALYMHDDDIIVPIEALDEVSFMSDELAGGTTSFAYLYEPSFAYLGAAH